MLESPLIDRHLFCGQLLQRRQHATDHRRSKLPDSCLDGHDKGLAFPRAFQTLMGVVESPVT
jgi:hypothetical protein